MEIVSRATPTGKRKKPVAVEIRAVPMLSESACGSVIPEPPRVANARIMPKTVPSKPIAGESVRRDPMMMPVRRSLRFAFILGRNYH